MFVPELKIAVASALSLLGNHSATALMAAGKFPDSPNPRTNLAIPKAITAPERSAIEETQCAEPMPGTCRTVEANPAANRCNGSVTDGRPASECATDAKVQTTSATA